MLPNWIIKKIDKKKDKFIQEELRIEEYPMMPINPKITPKEDESIIVIDLF